MAVEQRITKRQVVVGVDTHKDLHVAVAVDQVDAVSEEGSFGRFVWDVSRSPSDVAAILAKHGGAVAQGS